MQAYLRAVQVTILTAKTDEEYLYHKKDYNLAVVVKLDDGWERETALQHDTVSPGVVDAPPRRCWGFFLSGDPRLLYC